MSIASEISSPAAEIVKRFYTALANKDLEAARACCSPDVCFWHNFDAVTQDLEEASQGWRGLFAGFKENRIVDVRWQELPDGGLVQRHLFLLRGQDNVLKGKPCCILVKVSNGLISRLDEYIDLSGDLLVEEDVQVTAGLPARGFH